MIGFDYRITLIYRRGTFWVQPLGHLAGVAPKRSKGFKLIVNTVIQATPNK